MDDSKIKLFKKLAGQEVFEQFHGRTEAERTLGAQLLLSEVLEYVIKGLGVEPEFNGTKITDANALSYHIKEDDVDHEEMLDGLADVAYTMYWNSNCFGLKLHEAFDLICDNNLEKFVHLSEWTGEAGELPKEGWALDRGVEWPDTVRTVSVVKVGDEFYAVGKDESGKVRKPSTYKPVDLKPLLN